MSAAAMTLLTAPTAGAGHTADTPAKIKDAASQFEAMLVGQMLRSARENTSEDSQGSNSTYMELAEQQFAQALTARGGIGIAKMVVAQLGERNADQQ